jgi:hypothetical protein
MSSGASGSSEQDITISIKARREATLSMENLFNTAERPPSFHVYTTR